MKINPLYRSSLAKGSLLAIVPLVLSHSALGVVTVTFTESGPDVIVSFDGTLEIDPALPAFAFSTPAQGGIVENKGISSRQGTSAYATNGGTASGSGLLSVNHVPVESGDVGYFGFENGFVYWDSVNISGGTLVGGVSELTVTPATGSFTLPGQSLASLNADGIAQGTVLWTSTTNDTIIFASVAVPEPSSLLLCGLGAVGLLRRRR